MVYYFFFSEFLIKLLKSGARKIAIHAKEIFIEILKRFQFDITKGTV